MTAVRAPQARTPPLSLSELDERIIRAIGMCKFALAEDVQHLLGDVALSTLREHLRRLAGGKDYAEGAWLYRSPVPSRTKGTKARCYCPGVKGRQFLGQDGYYRPSRVLTSYSHLWHGLTLSRFYAAATSFCRKNPSFTLAAQLCYELARNSPTVTLVTDGKKARVPVIPDAVLWFIRSDGETLPVLLEVDRGTSGSRRVRAALHARIELIKSGEWERFFGTKAVRIAYLTTAGAARRDALELWAYDVIAAAISEEKHRQGWLEKFFFTSSTYEELFDPALFTDPVWQCPAFETTVPLLPPIPTHNTETRDGDIAQTTGTGEVTAALCDQTGLSADAAE